MEEANEAKQCLEHALRLSPRDPFNHDTWLGMAVAFLELNRTEDAVVAATTAVQQNPHHAWARRLLATSLALAGREEEARDATNSAMEVDPDSQLQLSKGGIRFATAMSNMWKR
jgi:adenylate cyclase